MTAFRPNGSDDRLARARLAARKALQVAGLDTTGELDLVFRSRQTVLRATVENTSAHSRDKVRRQDQIAVRVFDPAHTMTEALAEYRLASALHENGAPIAAPLHSPIETPDGLVGLWEFVGRGKSAVDMRAWGKALKRFHESGSDIQLQPYVPRQAMNSGSFDEKLTENRAPLGGRSA